MHRRCQPSEKQRVHLRKKPNSSSRDRPGTGRWVLRRAHHRRAKTQRPAAAAAGRAEALGQVCVLSPCSKEQAALALLPVLRYRPATPAFTW